MQKQKSSASAWQHKNVSSFAHSALKWAFTSTDQLSSTKTAKQLLLSLKNPCYNSELFAVWKMYQGSMGSRDISVTVPASRFQQASSSAPPVAGGNRPMLRPIPMVAFNPCVQDFCFTLSRMNSISAIENLFKMSFQARCHSHDHCLHHSDTHVTMFASFFKSLSFHR